MMFVAWPVTEARLIVYSLGIAALPKLERRSGTGAIILYAMMAAGRRRVEYRRDLDYPRLIAHSWSSNPNGTRRFRRHALR